MFLFLTLDVTALSPHREARSLWRERQWATCIPSIFIQLPVGGEWRFCDVRQCSIVAVIQPEKDEKLQIGDFNQQFRSSLSAHEAGLSRYSCR